MFSHVPPDIDKLEETSGRYFRQETDRLIRWMTGRLAGRLGEEKRPDAECSVEYPLAEQALF